MKITKETILDKWTEYTFTNKNGMQVSMLDYGGIITKLIVPDKDGKQENIVLSYLDYRDYERNPFYLGSIIGRVAGRVKQSKFTLDNTQYNIDQNEGEHHLHGGARGFHNVIWDAHIFKEENTATMKLHYFSPDNESGYPGNLDVFVFYTLTNENEFHIKYEAKTDKTTAISLTNHTYFNLSGQLKDTVEKHNVTVASDQYLAVNQELLPTGEKLHVRNTPFDLREGKPLKVGLYSNHEQNQLVGNGYDHYFLYTDNHHEKVVIKEEKSGRVMKVKTNQPGMVMYTANAMEEGILLREAESTRYLGVCFETQAPSASLWHPGLPSVTLSPLEKYCKETTFSFSVQQ